jgi:hypothetical protein
VEFDVDLLQTEIHDNESTVTAGQVIMINLQRFVLLGIYNKNTPFVQF